MHTDRKKWQEVSKLIAEMTIENKRNLWRGHLEKMAESNDASEAWKVVKALNGEAPTQSGKNTDIPGPRVLQRQGESLCLLPGIRENQWV